MPSALNMKNNHSICFQTILNEDKPILKNKVSRTSLSFSNFFLYYKIKYAIFVNFLLIGSNLCNL